MSRLKIGIILISDGWAGAENSVYNLGKSFIKLNNEINLFVNDEIIKYYKNIKNIKINNLGKTFNKNKLINIYYLNKAANKMQFYIEKNKLDVLIIFLESSSIIYSKIIKKNKIPVILSLRGKELEDYYFGKSLLFKISFKRILNNCIIIHSHSKWQTKILSKKYLSKLKIINNGINATLFHKRKIKIEKAILFCGRYLDWKGVRELVNIAHQLPQYEFWFAGQGPLETIINGENIKNLGFRKSKELVKLYNKATICVFPSWNEPFGNVGLEAMACGKPVIATPLGFSEYIENGKDGIIIPAKDEKALKEAIVKLMENPKLREKLSKNAIKKVKKYTWDKVAKEYLKVFKEAIAKSRIST